MTEATHRAAVAERAARAGGVVAKQTFRESYTVEEKSSPTDLVTSADRETQQQVLATIAQEFPKATVICEEEVPPIGAEGLSVAESVPETGDAWIIDPIDGTANYVREIRFWATSIAAVTGGEPIAAATYMPAVEDIYTAGPESVSRNDEPMTVSDRTDPAAFAVGVLGRWSGEPAAHGSLVRAVTARFGDVRRFGCMQGVLALVAAGSLDGAIMPDPPTAWDSVAGVYLIRRAGGQATTVDGERWQVGADSLVVSNGACHERLCQAAREATE